jgi:hypothetical protein
MPAICSVLTFEMSGGWKQAKLAGRRPLDGRVRPHAFRLSLEPIVGDTPTVAWQVLELVQSVKVIDWYLRDDLWFGQA